MVLSPCNPGLNIADIVRLFIDLSNGARKYMEASRVRPWKLLNVQPIIAALPTEREGSAAPKINSRDFHSPFYLTISVGHGDSPFAEVSLLAGTLLLRMLVFALFIWKEKRI